MTITPESPERTRAADDKRRPRTPGVVALLPEWLR